MNGHALLTMNIMEKEANESELRLFRATLQKDPPVKNQISKIPPWNLEQEDATVGITFEIKDFATLSMGWKSGESKNVPFIL